MERYNVSCDNAITIRQVSKTYGKKKVLDDVSFEVISGEITLLAGPNGAGKSTLLRIMCGLEKPDGGTLLINGSSYQDLNDPIQQVGSLLDATWLNADLSAAQNLMVLAELAGIDRARVNVCLEHTGLARVADRPVAQFSLGMRQRCGIAAALLGNPKILILDEPVNGLDPAGMAWLNGFLRRHCERGGTVLLSSHFLADSELLASRVVILGKGRTLWQGRMNDLTEGSKHCIFQSADNRMLLDHLRETQDSCDVSHLPDGRIKISVSPEVVSKAARKAQVDLTYLALERKTLAEAYEHIAEREVEYQ